MTLQEALNRIQETLESRKRDLEGVKERLERELAEEEQKKEWHQLHEEVKFDYQNKQLTPSLVVLEFWL